MHTGVTVDCGAAMPPSIQKLIADVPRALGSYGPILQEVEEVLADPQSSLIHVGAVIEKDPDLTARLLRLGNSAFYGFPSRLETVSEAVGLIGIQQVQDLISASNVMDTFSGVNPDFVNMESFWRHSLACGIGARILAIEKRMPKPEKFFVAGLLHDAGRLVLFSQAPQLAEVIMERAQQNRMLLRDAETEVMGFDHAQIGEALLRSWAYPPNLVQAVANHHHPQSADAYKMEAAIVHLSDCLVNAMELGSSGEHHVPPLQARGWQLLNLELNVLESTINAIDEQIEAVQEVFLRSKRN